MKKFFSKLKKMDILAGKHINQFDTQRAIRAYEIKSFTKKSMYEWFKNTKSEFEKNDFFFLIFILLLIVSYNSSKRKPDSVGELITDLRWLNNFPIISIESSFLNSQNTKHLSHLANN